MIVLHALPAIAGGGAQLSALETVAALRQAGATALVASAGGRMERAFAAAGARHFFLPLDTKNPLSILRNAVRLAALISAERVDLLHAHSRAVAWSALLAARRTHTPFVTTWHGAYGEKNPLKRRYNAVMASGDRVIAVSRFISGSINARHPRAAPRIRVIPPGIDPARFDPAAISPDRAAALARSWNLPPGRPVVMLPARLARWKGQRVLLEALARLADRSAIAVFVGPLEGRERYASALQSTAARLGIAERIRFPGATDDMPAALTLADIVVNASSEPEAFGRVIIEAAAMARPVIAADHGAAAETVLAGETGWRTPPGDSAALAAALDRFFALPPAARAAIGTAARAFALRSYSLAAMQEATLALYRELLSCDPAGRAATPPAPV
ncbi:MAG: glycosyltransferase family 4 protein [Rhodospirillales bacterium]|nr:glycosyltransferase family 4 protein [Rhodospirillales bacterium]